MDKNIENEIKILIAHADDYSEYPDHFKEGAKAVLELLKDNSKTKEVKEEPTDDYNFKRYQLIFKVIGDETQTRVSTFKWVALDAIAVPIEKFMTDCCIEDVIEDDDGIMYPITSIVSMRWKRVGAGYGTMTCKQMRRWKIFFTDEEYKQAQEKYIKELK